MPSAKNRLPPEKELGILVIDDDHRSRKLLKTALTDDAFFLQTASDDLKSCQIFDEGCFNPVLGNLIRQKSM